MQRGGPVLDEEGLVIGIAFQSLEDAENIGEMVPAALIQRFLESVASGRPARIPASASRPKPSRILV